MTLLGIRKYRGCAFDLWQGDSRTFRCDVFIGPPVLAPDGVASVEQRHDTPETLAAVLASEARRRSGAHIVLGAPAADVWGPQESAAFFVALKSQVDDHALASRRCTVAVGFDGDYDGWQRGLFAAFPESM